MYRGVQMNKKWSSGLTRNMREFGIIIAFIIILVALMIISPSAFASPRNLVGIVRQAAINGILACGMMFVIISNGIDLSVGSTVALAGVMAAHFAHPDSYPLVVPVVLAVVIGTAVGMINGLGVAYGNIPPFIITLATMTAVRGTALIASGGSPVYGLSDSFKNISSGTIGNTIIPVLAVYFICVLCLSGFILTKTVFGRHVYAVGSNVNVAHLSGINIARVTLTGYILCSVTAALGGVLVASKLQNGQPAACEGYEMYAIASTVLGGTSLTGGSGSVGRAMFGVAIIAVINNGMNLLHISSYWQKVVIGSIILLAVILDMAQKKKNA